MQFEFTEPQTEFEKAFGGHYCINAFGEIEGGDSAKFNDFLARTNPPPRTTVYINSRGGDVEAAMSIGRAIRDRWLSTSVGSYLLDPKPDDKIFVNRRALPGECYSAATLIFLGGRLRYLPNASSFGVHQFSLLNPIPSDLDQSQILSAKIAEFLSEMNITTEFIGISSATSSSAIDVLPGATLVKLGVVTHGVTDVSWSVEARGGMIYVKGERDSLYGHHKVMLGYSKGMGFTFWAVIETQGRSQELLNYGLVEITVNGEEGKVDISDRCERVEIGAYVNVFARITELEARQIALSEGFGVQIRLSSDAPMFLGIAEMPTANGSEQLSTILDTLSSDEPK